MEKIRAKFYCSKVDVDASNSNEQVTFHAQAADEIPENQRFNEATPSGNLTMAINNPGAKGFFEQGKSYYLDFTKAN